MVHQSARTGSGRMSSLARWLGLAGLIPQILLAAVVIGFPVQFSPPAIGLALVYSGLILSFIGGAWWGLAAQDKVRVPPWIWLVAIAPSLIAFAAIGAWTIGRSPGPSLMITGTSLIAALGVDFKLAANGLCPPGWLRLRTPLSLGLGGLTILIAILSP